VARGERHGETADDRRQLEDVQDGWRGSDPLQNLEERVMDVWDDVEIVVCPPFTALKSVSTVIELDKLHIGLAAQNVHWEAEGAFTGEVSVRMLEDLRCDYCIVGHSERREMFGETDETVNKKVRALLPTHQADRLCRRVARDA
jgi:triosephosphate isomerase (TIM)